MPLGEIAFRVDPVYPHSIRKSTLDGVSGAGERGVKFLNYADAILMGCLDFRNRIVSLTVIAG